jgi:hypothetical protein
LKFSTTFMLIIFYLMSSSSPYGSIFEKCSTWQILGNSKYCHNEGFSSIFIFSLHNKEKNKNFCTFATISRLVPINIKKLQNNKNFSTKYYKVHVCNLHASPATAPFVHRRPKPRPCPMKHASTRPRAGPLGPNLATSSSWHCRRIPNPWPCHVHDTSPPCTPSDTPSLPEEGCARNSGRSLEMGKTPCHHHPRGTRGSSVPFGSEGRGGGWWCDVDDVNNRPVGNPKRRYDEHNSKFSLSYETKVISPVGASQT